MHGAQEGKTREGKSGSAFVDELIRDDLQIWTTWTKLDLMHHVHHGF